MISESNAKSSVGSVKGMFFFDGFPVFPLGTEMTQTEQALIPVLGALKSAQPIDLLRMLWSGSQPVTLNREAKAALERLDLGKASKSWREHAMTALVLGAMRKSG